MGSGGSRQENFADLWLEEFLSISRGARVSFGLWILKVKGPTKNQYILTAEVVLMTVPGGVFPNQWEYYGLP